MWLTEVLVHHDAWQVVIGLLQLDLHGTVVLFDHLTKNTYIIYVIDIINKK